MFKFSNWNKTHSEEATQEGRLAKAAAAAAHRLIHSCIGWWLVRSGRNSDEGDDDHDGNRGKDQLWSTFSSPPLWNSGMAAGMGIYYKGGASNRSRRRRRGIFCKWVSQVPLLCGCVCGTISQTIQVHNRIDSSLVNCTDWLVRSFVPSVHGRLRWWWWLAIDVELL